MSALAIYHHSRNNPVDIGVLHKEVPLSERSDYRVF